MHEARLCMASRPALDLHRVGDIHLESARVPEGSLVLEVTDGQ